ncbi:MAG: YggS family pyridoxal phosphate-dependent enzyme [Deltaproteobacteria bacterium]|nr:YggS family pyridoxal phosphate-dependent enzyme [Deltaproteobacteria bacterium]
MAGKISENIIRVNDRIRSAARKSGRGPDEITLVAVTKTVEPKKIKEALNCGLRLFGENYVQEAEEKIKKIKDKNLRWHFIGHLQKNKAKDAAGLFDLIESVDSAGLAAEINKRAEKPMDVLIEVNVAGEGSKTGVGIDGAVELARTISGMKHLRLKGLMTIPPYNENPELSRPYFVTLRRIAERINKERLPGVFMRELSMGMSNDYEVAIEEGATIVRIGTAIFGPREAKTAKKPDKTANS